MQAKYFNHKTVYNGRVYDSKKEAKRAYELEMLQRAGLISNLEKQKVFELQPSFKINGKTERAITYLADFVYIKDNKTIIEDTKGFKTDVYKIKRKMLLYKYPDIIFVES